jgi:hypothetical protein
MTKPIPAMSPPRRLWRGILISLPVVVLVATVIVPPWRKVQLEMQEMLYGFAREVRVLSDEFVGHRPWFLVPKAVEIGRNTPGNFYRFERVEYRIDWLTLALEWAAAVAIAIGALVLRRDRPLSEPTPPTKP